MGTRVNTKVKYYFPSLPWVSPKIYIFHFCMHDLNGILFIFVNFLYDRNGRHGCSSLWFIMDFFIEWFAHTNSNTYSRNSESRDINIPNESQNSLMPLLDLLFFIIKLSKPGLYSILADSRRHWAIREVMFLILWQD